MTVRIDEVSTVIEPLPDNESGPGPGPGDGEAPAPFEVQIEELRPLVRALVAEEMERWLRKRSDCP